MVLVLCDCASSSLESSITADQETELNAPHLPITETDIRGIITDLQKVPQRANNKANTNQSDLNTPVSSEEVATGSLAGSGDVVGVVLIEENPHEEHGSQKDSVTIRESTRLFKQREQCPVFADFKDFEIGQRVRAWYTGPVAESYPRQATARMIVIERG